MYLVMIAADAGSLVAFQVAPHQTWSALGKATSPKFFLYSSSGNPERFMIDVVRSRRSCNSSFEYSNWVAHNPNRCDFVSSGSSAHFFGVGTKTERVFDSSSVCS